MGVTKCFQDRVGLQNLLLEFANLVGLVARGDRGQVLDDLFRVLGLACAGLSRDQDRLIVAVLEHVVVCGIRDRVDVWGHFVTLLVPIGEDDFIGIDGELAVWIDGNQEEARVGLRGLFGYGGHERVSTGGVYGFFSIFLDSKMEGQIKTIKGGRPRKSGKR